jgi:hypothetical protein
MGKGFWLFNFVGLEKYKYKYMAILFDIHKLAKLVEYNSCSFLKFVFAKQTLGKKIL